ncbi:MAG: hypothetical protein ACJ71U_09090 [Terriglobales bacterium]
MDESFSLELKDRHAFDNDIGEEGEVNTLESLLYLARSASLRAGRRREEKGFC